MALKGERKAAMENLMGLLVGLAIITIAILCGAFRNNAYPKKYAQKKATEIKIILESIYNIEHAQTVEDVAASYSGFVSNIDDLLAFYNLNSAAFAQTASMANVRYQNIHNRTLTSMQQAALGLKIDIQEAYSECLVNAFERFVSKMELQINSLKTDIAKEKRRAKIIDSLTLCVSELNAKGNPEYIMMLPDMVAPFDIVVKLRRENEINADDSI
ncbi:hypothetical protein [uncultured Alistipes sp.]|uniref:hypothetical protein n=1 Tax=uncultured Alistipes sp. TaxID=538949 RepID=UPI00263101A7|nr:hypothetical protein [uncultured Alistipes sp.]